MSGYWKFYFLPALFLCCWTGLAQSPRSTATLRDPKLPVLKAAEPIEIIGTVIAHDRDGGVGLPLVDVYAYLDVLVIRIERRLKGNVAGDYVRADFLGGDSGHLPDTLFDGKQWIMKLEPVQQNHWMTCDWTIRPEPPVGDLLRDFWMSPRLVQVGRAGYIPDINALQCYTIVGKNLLEFKPTTQR
jgi:hypothetical protein